MIPPFRYSFSAKDIDFVSGEIRTMLGDGEYLTLGRWNDEFEKEFAAAHKAANAVAVSSGTAGLEILLRAVGVSGKRVIAPSNTFGATLISIIRAGGIPALVDCGDDLCIDPVAVEALLDGDSTSDGAPDVAAVVTVHIGGLISADLPRLVDTCDRFDVPLLEDAAHAVGASLGGRFAGTFGRGAAFSLFSTKVITSGEGGMILTADDELAAHARLLRDHAKRPDGGMDETGYNWRLTELQALLAVAQTRRLSEIISERTRVARGYADALQGLPEVSVLDPATDARSNYYKVVVRIPPGLRERVKQRMRADFDVQMSGEVYAVPCHRQPAFAEFATGPFPVTDAISAGHVCPPVYPDMSDTELAHAASSLATVLEEEVGRRSKTGLST